MDLILAPIFGSADVIIPPSPPTATFFDGKNEKQEMVPSAPAMVGVPL